MIIYQLQSGLAAAIAIVAFLGGCSAESRSFDYSKSLTKVCGRDLMASKVSADSPKANLHVELVGDAADPKASAREGAALRSKQKGDELIRAAVAQALASRGICSNVDAAERPTVELQISKFGCFLTRDANVRDGYVEGKLFVAHNGTELYSRKLAILAERKIKRASSGLVFISGLGAGLAMLAEDNEASESLMTDLLSKLQDEVAADSELFDVISGTEVIHAALGN